MQPYAFLSTALTNDPAHLKAAIGALGVKEAPGPLDNPLVLEMLQGVGIKGRHLVDSTAWCAAFVGWCIRKTGRRGTGSPMARSYINYGLKVNPVDIKRGDIVLFTRPGGGSGSGHVGFYLASEGGAFLVLGGNQNDSVCVAPYSRSRLLAVRRIGSDVVVPGHTKA